MKLFLISIAGLLCLCGLTTGESIEISSDDDELDVVKLATEDAKTLPKSEAQRKRDSGYVYPRPDRLTSSRYETTGIRGRIVTKYPSGQTARPFNRYGPPKQTRPQFSKPSDQYAPQHSYVLAHGSQQHPRPRPQHNKFSGQTGQFGNAQIDQGVPNPTRTNDFVELSPISSQNDIPFNSNAANYLPPRNQKLPVYANPNRFSNYIQSTGIPPVEQFNVPNDNDNHHHQQQNSNGQHGHSQQFVQNQFNDQQQISDAAIFLTQNAQAISQLYDAPATNLNYEPSQDSGSGIPDPASNPNSQFQTFETTDAASQRLQDSRGFQGHLPSYASGYLDSERTLEQFQSLRKDRLIAQLQQALAQTTPDVSESSRYAQNHQTGNFIQSQNIFPTLGTQINPSIGPQAGDPNPRNLPNSYGIDSSDFGRSTTFLPAIGTTASGLSVTYGLHPSPTPATQSPSTTTTIVSVDPTSPAPQRPTQGSSGEGSSHVGNSAPTPGTSLTFPFPQYGGFVPTLVGTNVLAGYPTYGNHFLGSSSPTVGTVQSSGSSPTHFGIPIPTIPAATSGPAVSTKPQHPSHHHHHLPSTPVHAVPLQPVQPIHPIAATPVHPIFSIAPSVPQLHPLPNPGHAGSAHPTYGLQPAGINPIIVKPVKGVYPVYYYPNVYQIQKSGARTLPWAYAPAYGQPKPQQIWK